MDKHRDEHGQGKRKISAISHHQQNQSHNNSNEFAKYADEFFNSTDSKRNGILSSVELREGHDPKKVLSFISDLLGLFTSNGPKDVAPSPEEGNMRSPKRQKISESEFVTPPNNRAESMADQVLVTPPAKATGIHPSTPSSVLSAQSSINSTDSGPIMHSNGDGCSCSHKGSATPQGNFRIYRQILQHPEVQGVFDFVKSSLEPILLKKMKKNVGLELEEVTVESGLETAASIDLLKLFGASNPVLEEIGERAHNGAMMLQEGLKKVNEGKRILELAFTQISKHIN